MLGRPTLRLARPQCCSNFLSTAGASSTWSKRARSSGRVRTNSGRRSSHTVSTCPACLVSMRRHPNSSAAVRQAHLPWRSMLSSEARLHELQDRHRDLARQILELGLISQGSVVLRHTTCRTPGCRCHADPPQPHGPYWQWTRYDSGKTITRRLTEPQPRLYQEWIANRRRLADIIAEMEKVGEQAAEILLQQAQPEPDDQAFTQLAEARSRPRAAPRGVSRSVP